MPTDEPADLTLPSFELNLNLHVYADVDKQTAIAAPNLRHLGNRQVYALIGGLDAGKKANYLIVVENKSTG